MTLYSPATGTLIHKAAKNLIGTPFRLYGRDTETGLDCIGLVVISLERTGYQTGPLPSYKLRGSDTAKFDALAKDIGLDLTDRPDRAGDIVMMKTGPAQLHLGIRCSCGGLIHADGGLRKVVHQPPPICWPMAGGWRANPHRKPNRAISSRVESPGDSEIAVMQ